MRPRITILGLLLCAVGALPAQERELATVELNSGARISGELVRADSRAVVIAVEAGELTIAADEVAKLHRGVLPQDPGTGSGATDPAAGEGRPAAGDPVGGVAALRAAQDEPAVQSVPAAPAGETARPGRRRAPPAVASGSDHRLVHFFDRYLWLVPHAQGHRAALGAALLFVLAWLLQFSGRAANIENSTFGRSAVLAALVFGVAVAELSVERASPPVVIAFLVLDAVLWFVVVRILYSASFKSSLLMLLGLMLTSSLAVLGLECVAFIAQNTMDT